MNIEIFIFLAIAATVVFLFMRKAANKKKRLDSLMEASRDRKTEKPAVATPADKRAKPLLHLSPDALLKIQFKLDFDVSKEWRESHPMEKLPWEKVLGPNYEKLMGMVGPAFSVDVSLLSYAVLVGCAANRDPRFFNCRLHKEIEKKFVKNEAASIKLYGMNCKTFGVPAPEGIKQINPIPLEATIQQIRTGVLDPEGSKQNLLINPSPFIATIQQIRTAAWHYADPKRPAPSEEARLVRLLGSTVLMRLMAENFDCQPFVFGLVRKMIETASVEIDALVNSLNQTLAEQVGTKA